MMSGIVFRIQPKKEKSYLVWPKGEEKQNKNDSICQGPSNGMMGWWSHEQLPKIVKNQML